MGEKSVRTRGRVVARAGGPNAAARDNAPMAKMDRIVLQWVAAGGLGSYARHTGAQGCRSNDRVL